MITNWISEGYWFPVLFGVVAFYMLWKYPTGVGGDPFPYEVRERKFPITFGVFVLLLALLGVLILTPGCAPKCTTQIVPMLWFDPIINTWQPGQPWVFRSCLPSKGSAK